MTRTGSAVAMVLAMAASSGAWAQQGQQGSHNPAVKNSAPHEMSMAAHGRNSFTEDQARGRLMKAGYSRISKLSKDANGVWRGMAYRGGKQVRVGLDYKGNVTR